MKRIEKAFINFPDGIVDDSEFFNKEDYLTNFCPFNLGVDDTDYSGEFGYGDNVAITGCRGISCFECWNGEVS